MQSKLRNLVALAAMAFALCAPGVVTAQPATEAKDLSAWLREEVLTAAASQGAIPQNGTGIANQTESPSADQASTSLVDTSSASDFVSLALNLTGLTADEEDSTPASGSVTATLYSLMAAAKGVAMTDPDFYREGTKWRRLALTVGSEESKLEEHFTDKPSTNVGAKLLLLNNRDIYSASAQNQLRAMANAVNEFVEIEQDERNEIECLVFRTLDRAADRTLADCRNDPAFASFLSNLPFNDQNWPANLEELNKEENAAAMEEVRQIVGRLAAGRNVATAELTSRVEEIQRGRQLAIAYYTKQREDDGTDEHRAELIFDYGFSKRLNWTANASYDYRNLKQGEAQRGTRFATELQAKLNSPGNQLRSTRPVTLSASGEASDTSDSDWLIRAQVKLVVPITAGVEVPIAYTYANRDDETQGISSGSQLKLSIAVDPVRLRERFRFNGGS